MGSWRSCLRRGRGSRVFALSRPLPQQAPRPPAQMSPRLPHTQGGLPRPRDAASSAEKARPSSSDDRCSLARAPSNDGVCCCDRRRRSPSLEINTHNLWPLALAIRREEGRQAQNGRETGVKKSVREKQAAKPTERYRHAPQHEMPCRMYIFNPKVSFHCSRVSNLTASPVFPRTFCLPLLMLYDTP